MNRGDATPWTDSNDTTEKNQNACANGAMSAFLRTFWPSVSPGSTSIASRSFPTGSKPSSSMIADGLGRSPSISSNERIVGIGSKP